MANLISNAVIMSTVYGMSSISYKSDFSVDADGWTGTNLTVAGNIDSILTVDNVMRGTLDATVGEHKFIKEVLTSAQRYRLTFQIYVPAAQTIDGFDIVQGSGTQVLAITTGTGAWQSVDVTFTADDTDLEIRAADGANVLTVNASTDVYYVHSIILTKA